MVSSLVHVITIHVYYTAGILLTTHSAMSGDLRITLIRGELIKIQQGDGIGFPSQTKGVYAVPMLGHLIVESLKKVSV
jgi:hypothetical protein